MSDKYPRTKASILRSGIDPDCKRLSKLHAIRSSAEKKHRRALESVEHYWDTVFQALEEQEKETA